MKLSSLSIRKLGMIGLLVLMSVPFTGCGSMLTLEQEIAIGEENAPKFLNSQGGNLPDASVVAYVREIGMKMVEQIEPGEQRDLPWEFFVLDSPMINAFALPGGKIFMTRGLMVRLQNEAQLAAVLGHEVGHVVGQHVGEQMTRQAIIQYGLEFATQYSESQWVSVLGGTGGQLYLLKFGRGHELEADSYGLDYIVSAGYDPHAIIGVMQILKEASGGNQSLEILSTHPHPESRISQAEEFIKQKYAFTQNNPQFVTKPDAYRQRALVPISKLGPPQHQPQQQ